MFSGKTRNEDFNKAVKKLNDVSTNTGLTYLSSGHSRAAYFKEIRDFINHITHEVDIHCMSLSGAIKTLNEETAYLRDQQFQLLTGRMVQYAAVEKNGLVALLICW